MAQRKPLSFKAKVSATTKGVLPVPPIVILPITNKGSGFLRALG